MMLQGPKDGSSGNHTTLAEINVTPFVDVMLVLLIVFMVSAPLMQQGLEVNLPKAEGATLEEGPDPVVLTVTASETIQIDGQPVSREALKIRLSELGSNPETSVHIQADASVSYGLVAGILSDVKMAKIERVGLVTEEPPPEPPTGQ